MASAISKSARVLIAVIIALLCFSRLRPLLRDDILVELVPPSSASSLEADLEVSVTLPGRVIPVGERHPVSRHLSEYTRINKMNDGSFMAGFGCEDENETDVGAMCFSHSADVGLTWTDISQVVRDSNQ